MKISIVYVYPACIAPNYTDLAIRFIESYNANPPGISHDTIVVLNGSKQTSEIACLFSSLPNVAFLERSNDAYDIGAYQDAAAMFPCDMMVFFGSSSYIRHPNWLALMEQAFKRHGMALFGVMANKGVGNIYPHLRTTGFWCPPDLINSYPHRITRADQRYAWEHGQNCFTSWVKRRGLKAWLMDARGRTYSEKDWNEVPNGFHKGNQSNLLIGDRLSCPPFTTAP